jgi:hypothetical protein
VILWLLDPCLPNKITSFYAWTFFSQTPSTTAFELSVLEMMINDPKLIHLIVKKNKNGFSNTRGPVQEGRFVKAVKTPYIVQLRK